MPNSLQFPAFSWPGSFVVLADDITGAAEIAGIANSYGLKTKLTTTIGASTDGCDVLVIATDWRQMPEATAMAETRRATEYYKDSLIFKKTDSVLRGHIFVECFAMHEILPEKQILLIAQNPSKGRVVHKSIYYINEKPLSETSFSYDPEYPAKSSNVREILKNNVESLSIPQDFVDSIITIPDAVSIDDIKHQLSANNPQTTVFAGGADLFSSMLSIYHNSSATKDECQDSVNKNTKSKIQSKPNINLSSQKAIIVCGSTQSTDISKSGFCRDNDFFLTKMPESVFHGIDNPDIWIDELKTIYSNHNLILTIGHKPQGGQSYAIRLRDYMANAVKELASDITPNLLIIEGGATAYQIIQTLGWQEFLVSKEYAPGVVELIYNTTRVILKPGSYNWGNLFE